MGKVDPSDCWDAMVNGAAGDEELDNILSILDFPMESLEGDGFIGDWDASKSSHYLVPIPSDVLMDTGPPVLPPPINATPELKELSSYLPKDSSHSFIIQPSKSAEAQEPKGLCQTQSPVSVLESNGSGKIPITKSCKRARSKRPRPSGLSTWLSMLLPSDTARKACSTLKNRDSRRKLSQQSVEEDSSDNAKNPFQAITKRCAHCQVTRTPQWREGPTGPKTLCNACGVRYRSGRLFPEYRPAASPTFVPSLHSNSHRKVVEMRTKGMKQPETKVEQPSMSPEMEFVPMSNYLFDDPMC